MAIVDTDAAVTKKITRAELFKISDAAGGQIKFPATQNASADANTLDDYSETSFTATLTGCTTSPTYTVYATKIGNEVTLNIPTWSGTSNAVTKTFTGMPAALRPTNTQGFLMATQDNGGAAVASLCTILSSGVINFFATAGGGAFTNSGSVSGQLVSISYQLN